MNDDQQDPVLQPDQDSVFSKQVGDTSMDGSESFDKGKGKMAQPEDLMEEDDDEESSEDDEQPDGEVDGGAEEDADEDGMEEIDLDNIVGTRTRGKNIDYAQAAKDLPEEEDEEDDEDDDDFEDEDMMED